MTGVITKNGKNLYLHRLIDVTKTVPSLFKVGTGATAPTEVDTDLQIPVIISGGSYTKAFSAGYPIVTEASKQLTIRAVLSSTEANGNVLTEFGVFNTDGTPLMYSRDTYAGITKNSGVQVVYEVVDEFV